MPLRDLSAIDDSPAAVQEFLVRSGDRPHILVPPMRPDPLCQKYLIIQDGCRIGRDVIP